MRNNTLLKVLIAIALAIAAGTLTGTESGFAGITYYQLYQLFGQLFLNALTLVVVPLVAASIITGAAKIGGEDSAGQLGLKIFGYFFGTSFLAIFVGWILANLLQPGHFASEGLAFADSKLLEIASQAKEGTFAKVEQIFLKIIPSNILLAASQGQMLGLIFFSLLFGFFLSRIDKEPARVLIGFWQGIFQVMMKMTQLVMTVLPFGVFALVAKVVASTGLKSIFSVGYFFSTVLLGLAIYMLVILPILLKFIAKVSPIAHFKAMLPALITAFSTTSSAATLPVTIECVEKKVGVSNRIASFMLPLGASVNLAGSSLQVIVAVFTVAQIYGMELSLASQGIVFLMTLLLSFGMAGIPSASIISIILILSTIGFPSDAIALILAVERILDMFRTMVNVFSNSCCSVLVARSEKEILKI
ncbi:Proton/sodium-glutamate symport protein [Chlamydiales bacterium STE3]|nr:Proton/sodium-glutamate symport protein [Chlamydiales bacterium STE3]